MTLRDGGLHLLNASGEVFDLACVGGAVLVDVVEVDASVGDGAFAELVQLVALMEVLEGLLQAESDEDAEDDGADVDEEIGPGVVGFVRWVDVDHG